MDVRNDEETEVQKLPINGYFAIIACLYDTFFGL